MYTLNDMPSRFLAVMLLHDPFRKLTERLAVLTDNLVDVGLQEEGKRLS
jgi:hypothetical protein